MGDRICRSSGAGIHQATLSYKYVAATRLGALHSRALDGKALIVPDNRTGTTNLWSFPLDSGPMKQLTDFKPDELFSRELSFDGKLMAISRGPVTSDVILISDFRQEKLVAQT